MSLEQDGWIPTCSGGWCRPGEGVVIFRKDTLAGGWGVACNNAFSKGSYKTAAAAAEAYADDRICWVDPEAWVAKKDGSGWYRRAKGRGVLSVKQARSGAWFWVSSQGGGAHGWFQTAEQAMADADGPSAPTKVDEIEPDLETLLEGFDD